MMSKINWHLPVVFIIPLLIYLFSMPLSVALEDDGFFIMSSYFNGVSHPPGYPLHSLLGKLFTLIPVSTVAARVHAVSSVFGALTCVMLWLLIHNLLNNKLIAYSGALIYAFSKTFWSQAIIAEVYTLNTFFFFALFYLLLKISQNEPYNSEDKPNSLIYFAAFVFGLSLCNHWPLMLLSSLCLFILILPVFRGSPSIFFKSMPFILIGLFPYGWMVFNSQSNPVISFTGSIDSWTEFFDFIARKRYSAVDASSSAGVSDKLNFLLFYLEELLAQFTYGGFVFIAVGLCAQFKYFNKSVIYALLAGFFCNSFLLILLLGFDFELIYRSVITPYFLVSYGIASLWLSVGLYYCYILIIENILPLPVEKNVFIFACCIYVIIVLTTNLSTNYRHDYDWGSSYAASVLNSLPKDSVIILNDDISVGTIGYVRLVELVRPDITLLTDKATVFRDRLYDPSLITAEEGRLIVNKFIRNEERPVYTTDVAANIYPNDHWLTRSFSNDLNGQYLLHVSSLDKNYLRYIYKQNNNHDAWTYIHRKKLLVTSLPFVVESKLQGDTDVLFDEIIYEFMNDLDGLILLIRYARARNIIDLFGGLESLLLKAESLYLVSSEKVSKADYLQFCALIKKEQNDLKGFENYLIKSIREWPNVDNLSFNMLSDAYVTEGRSKEYNIFIQEFGDLVIEKYLLH